MSHRLTVHVTADTLEGALNRVTDIAKRYFGDRLAQVVETRAESTVHGPFMVHADLEDVTGRPSVRCGVLDHATLSVCVREPHAEAEPHVASSGRHFFA